MLFHDMHIDNLSDFLAWAIDKFPVIDLSEHKTGNNTHINYTDISV